MIKKSKLFISGQVENFLMTNGSIAAQVDDIYGHFCKNSTEVCKNFIVIPNRPSFVCPTGLCLIFMSFVPFIGVNLLYDLFCTVCQLSVCHNLRIFDFDLKPAQIFEKVPLLVLSKSSNLAMYTYKSCISLLPTFWDGIPVLMKSFTSIDAIVYWYRWNCILV